MQLCSSHIIVVGVQQANKSLWRQVGDVKVILKLNEINLRQME
jgi:hypothetical protein